MKFEKEYLLKLVEEENQADFLEDIFSKQSEFKFLDKLNKNLKKQVGTAIKIEKIADGTSDSLDTDVYSGDISIKYKGHFVKGEISLTNLHKLITFFGANSNPKVDEVNDALIYYSKNYKIFVSRNESNVKSISLLYKYESKEQLQNLYDNYFDVVFELQEMSDEDILKLSYDISDFEYSNNREFFSNKDYISIQESLFSTYNQNPFDLIATLALVYRLKNLGWESDFIYFASESGKSFNLLNSLANIRLDKFKIEALVDNNFLDEKLDLTEDGRSLLSLLNYFVPILSNNLGNMFASMNYYLNNKEIKREDFISVNHDSTNLYGIKEDFFVCEKCLGGVSKSSFHSNTQYNGFLSNLINSLERGREIGYAPNLQINSNLDFEVCQKLFNTFNDDILDAIGGLVMIKTYMSDEPIFINSLIYRLVKNKYFNITPFISKSNKDYIVLKDNESGEIVAVIKTKTFSCQKEAIGTQDKLLLMKKLINNHNSKIYGGLDVNESYPSILGYGFIEKSQLTIEDYNNIKNTPFNNLRSTIRQINKDLYFNDLNESDIIQKIISQRKSEYEDFVNNIKDIMNEKLKAIEIILNHFIDIGNQEKQEYYNIVIDDYKNKINKFVL